MSRSPLLARAYDLCVEKARRNIRRLADAPKSGAFAADGDYFGFHEGFFEISNWTSSFFTGMALLAYRSTGDTEFLAQCNRLKAPYREKVVRHGMDTMHDLGFLYTLYSVAAYKQTGDREHRETALLAAAELAKRFVPEGKYLRAWGRMDENRTDYAGLAIIDSLMNLPLLCWAAAESGDFRLREIADRHASTVLEYFVRPDDSVCHSFRFDPRTGAPVGADNYCGRTVESCWARGTSWAIYGFALMHGYTREARYREAALRVARKFVSLLDEELVPVWDFSLPEGEPRLRDSSAAAIAACGLDELQKYLPGETGLTAAADALTERLCSSDYLDERLECPGLLKHAQIGDGVGKARVAYSSWGDYFFMEALARRLHGDPRFW